MPRRGERTRERKSGERALQRQDLKGETGMRKILISAALVASALSVSFGCRSTEEELEDMREDVERLNEREEQRTVRPASPFDDAVRAMETRSSDYGYEERSQAEPESK